MIYPPAARPQAPTADPIRVEAEDARAAIDRTACGGRCVRRHWIAYLPVLSASPRRRREVR